MARELLILILGEHLFVLIFVIMIYEKIDDWSMFRLISSRIDLGMQVLGRQ